MASGVPGLTFNSPVTSSPPCLTPTPNIGSGARTSNVVVISKSLCAKRNKKTTRQTLIPSTRFFFSFFFYILVCFVRLFWLALFAIIAATLMNELKIELNHLKTYIGSSKPTGKTSRRVKLCGVFVTLYGTDVRHFTLTNSLFVGVSIITLW